jgi:hypothetical protein
LPYEALRPMVGAGARGMVGVAFGVGPETMPLRRLRDAVPGALRRAPAAVHTAVFEAMQPVLDRPSTPLGLPWGIVTNKAMRFTDRWSTAWAWPGAAVVIAATPRRTPSPTRPAAGGGAPQLGVPLSALRLCGRRPARHAGRPRGRHGHPGGRLGLPGAGEPIEAWGADHVLSKRPPALEWLELA